MSATQPYQIPYYHLTTREVIRNLFRNGIASSNIYQVKFDITNSNSTVANTLSRLGFTGSTDKFSAQRKVELLCSSSNLPGATVNTSTINSAYPGYNLDFPIAHKNHEIELTFYMDKEMLPYRFFHGWLRAINPRFYKEGSGKALVTKSRFYEEVVQDFYIYKFPDVNNPNMSNIEDIKPTQSLTNTSDLYIRAIDCYPINIGSVNQSYELASLMTFNVSLSYRDIEFAPIGTFVEPGDYNVNNNSGFGSNASNNDLGLLRLSQGGFPQNPSNLQFSPSSPSFTPISNFSQPNSFTQNTPSFILPTTINI